MRYETTQLAATTRLWVGWRYGPMQPAAITPLLAHKRSISTKPAAKTRLSVKKPSIPAQAALTPPSAIEHSMVAPGITTSPLGTAPGALSLMAAIIFI